MKFGFMYVNRTEFRIDRMAKVLQVSQSGYYKWVRRMEAPLTEKEREDRILKDKIFELFRQSRGSYGSRKITAQINRDSERPINHKRIERIMRENDLFSKARKKFVCLTDSDHSYPVAENLLARDFSADRPNQKMVSDTTEVSTEEGKLYVAGILDLYGRMPVGFAISVHNDRYLVMHALEEALTTVSKFLDDAALVGASKVRILHGKGTGVLKEEIRKWLKVNASVVACYDEDVRFGGAGITVVELD